MLSAVLGFSAACITFSVAARRHAAAVAWAAGRLTAPLTLLKREDEAHGWAVAVCTTVPVLAVLGAVLGGIAAAFLLAFVAGALPFVLAQRLAARRVARVERQFPAALDSLAAALRAGQSLSQAVAWTAREAPEPTAGEFGRLDRELQLGRTPEQAFGEWARRFPAAGPQAVALTLGPLRAAGANLIPAFEALSENLRRRAGSEEKMSTLSAQAKMQLRLLALLTPALAGLLFVLDPRLARQLAGPEGLGIAGLAAALQIAGVVMAKRILNPNTLWQDQGGQHDRQ